MKGYYRLVSDGGERHVRVRRIFGAVANFGNPLSDEPVIFLKPPEAIIWEGEAIRVPAGETALFEGELVVAIGKDGRTISPENAMSYVAAYGAGLDMTLERFRKNREQGLPWAMAKGFDTSACLSAFVPSSRVPDYQHLSVELLHNGEQRQSASLADLITPVPALIAFISRFMALEPGDLIFTGTPPGAAPVDSGDTVTVRVPTIAEATFPVA
jgi:2-keto-4-pentenoate hydratase/2-oxohepta-3-ene-1,7-dioic acid hydratase in catechol pathway